MHELFSLDTEFHIEKKIVTAFNDIFSIYFSEICKEH